MALVIGIINSHCKLFRFTDGKTWAPVGIGKVHILQNNDTGKIYLRMRGNGSYLVNQFGTPAFLSKGDAAVMAFSLIMRDIHVW